MFRNMRIFIFLSLTVFLALAISKTAFSDNRYWVNGSGNWNDPQQWSETSGGTPGASVPTKNDHVIFDNNSFTSSNQTITIKDVVYCNDFRWEVDNYQPTLKSSAFLFKKLTKAEIHVYGSLIINKNVNHAFFGDIVLKSDNESTIEVDSKLTADLIIDAENGKWTQESDLSTKGNVILRGGNFSTQSKTIECNSFITFGEAARHIDFGDSRILVNSADLRESKNLTIYSNNLVFELKESAGKGDLELGSINASYTKLGNKASFSVTVTPSEPLCYDGEDGSIQVDVSGGVAPYTYTLRVFKSGSWQDTLTDSTSDSTYTFNNLKAKEYQVSVTDSDGSGSFIKTEVTQPDELKNLKPTVTNPLSCFDGSDGEITANPDGGTSPYTYQWLEYVGPGSEDYDTLYGETNVSLSNIPQGIYRLLLNDANGCGGTDGVPVDFAFQRPPISDDNIIPPELIIDDITHTNTCTGNNTGSINITASGG
ncbi:MAG: SprB repeat-containing protein, partial [Bacteroidota bacterium]